MCLAAISIILWGCFLAQLSNVSRTFWHPAFWHLPINAPHILQRSLVFFFSLSVLGALSAFRCHFVLGTCHLQVQAFPRVLVSVFCVSWFWPFLMLLLLNMDELILMLPTCALTPAIDSDSCVFCIRPNKEHSEFTHLWPGFTDRMLHLHSVLTFNLRLNMWIVCSYVLDYGLYICPITSYKIDISINVLLAIGVHSAHFHDQLPVTM